MNAAQTIAETLDRHLMQPTEVVVFGSSALLLYRMYAVRLAGRSTNDVDIIIPPGPGALLVNWLNFLYRIMNIVQKIAVICSCILTSTFGAESRILIPAKINDQQVRFIFDTGADQVILWHSTAHRMRRSSLDKRFSALVNRSSSLCSAWHFRPSGSPLSRIHPSPLISMG